VCAEKECTEVQKKGGKRSRSGEGEEALQPSEVLIFIFEVVETKKYHSAARVFLENLKVVGKVEGE